MGIEPRAPWVLLPEHHYVCSVLQPCDLLGIKRLDFTASCLCGFWVRLHFPWGDPSALGGERIFLLCTFIGVASEPIHWAPLHFATGKWWKYFMILGDNCQQKNLDCWSLCVRAQLGLTFCDPVEPVDSSVLGIFQASILEWVAIPSFRGSSRHREQTQVSCIAGGFFTAEPLGRSAND